MKARMPGGRRQWILLLCLPLAAILCFVLYMPGSVHAATDCSVISGKTPRDATKLDCPSPPCAPNACSCTGGGCASKSAAVTAGSLYGGCGPVTTCVLLGSDPPISNPAWDEPLLGPPVPNDFFSGKCPPPTDSGSFVCPTTYSAYGAFGSGR